MFERLFLQKGLSFESLHAFHEVCEAGSINKATLGEKNLSTRYSRHINGLEDFFGIKLTKIVHKSKVPNEKGLELYALINEVFQNIEDFNCDCQKLPYEISIGAGDSWLQWLVLPRIGNFQSKIEETGRKINFSVHCRQNFDILSDLLNLHLDYGILRESELYSRFGKNLTANRDRIQYLKIGKSSYQLVVPDSLIDLIDDPQSASVFTRLPLVSQSNHSYLNNGIIQKLKPQELDFNMKLQCESFPEIRTALQSGKYAAVVNQLAKKQFDSNNFTFINHPLLEEFGQNMLLAWNDRLIQIRPPFLELSHQLVDLLKF